ncbi:MAG: helicase-associated domain-containing protein [Paenibacillus sp.]|nr:helicase-associated domain-containing protein [Paenibacillus sp.]
MQLTPHARTLLKKIYAAYAGQPFEEGEEEQFRPVNLCRAELRLAMSELRQSGLLAALGKMWGEKLYYIPEDKLPVLQSFYFDYTPSYIDTSDIHVHMEEGQSLASELFRALLFVAQEGLPITAKGSIHKKNISRLASKLTLQEKHLRGLAVRWPYPEIYPMTAAFIIDLMLCMGLLNRGDNAYTLNVEFLEQWLNLTELQMSNHLFQIVMHRYGSSEPSSQHFRYLIMRPEIALKEWVSVEGLLDWMESSMLVSPVQCAGLSSSSLSWLEFMAGCGWCQVGTNQEGESCFRWLKLKLRVGEFDPAPTALTSPSDLFIVQSDFEVLVPPEVPYSVRWSLATCAELLTIDSMWSYRLTREQLVSANEQGVPPQDVLSWLDSCTMGGLPLEVKQVLEQWGRDIGRTLFTEALLLSCRDAEDADLIAAHPRLQGLLFRLGPLHISVPKEYEEYVRKELTAAGMAPPSIVEGRDSVKLAAIPQLYRKREEQADIYTLPPTNLEQGLIPINTPLLYLQQVPLEAEGLLLPGLESVPSMWSKEWHSYHSSTAQKIMEQALSWGIKVRISLEEQIYEFIPSRVLGNPWRIAGYLLPNTEEGSGEERELPAGSWNEMQLLIPRATTIPPSVRAPGYVMINESTIKVDQHYT